MNYPNGRMIRSRIKAKRVVRVVEIQRKVTIAKYQSWEIKATPKIQLETL